MKWSIADFNGVLTDLKTKVGPQHLTTPRNCDAMVVWQDVSGSFGDLIKAMKYTGTSKPTFVVQHGRGATTDYDKPNSYPFSSDYFLCWGTSDFDRMCRLGYSTNTVIVGCPLNTHIKPKVPHKEKVVLFVPVNTGKEEPENIAVYYELLKMKYDKARMKVQTLQSSLKEKWSVSDKPNVPFNALAEDFDVVAKLLPWHDAKLYHGNTVLGTQYSSKNNELIFNLLRNVDLVVGLDEGCTEIFAMAHDVPVVIVDGFRYANYLKNGYSFEKTGVLQTKGATHCTIDTLRETIEAELANPDRLKKERAEVAEVEMGISYGNPTENIYKFVREYVKTTCE